jgi:hypothetical protein
MRQVHNGLAHDDSILDMLDRDHPIAAIPNAAAGLGKNSVSDAFIGLDSA